jgi:translation elongation factor EF-1beta
MIYSVISESTMWSTDTLKQKVERILNEKTRDGYEIVSVAFGVNMWWLPTAFITLRKNY